MKWLMTIAFLLLLINKGLGQNEVTFEDPPNMDTLTRAYAVPIGIYKSLLAYLQTKISDGDTLGKKYPIQLYNVRFNVDKSGNVDSAYIGVNHDACHIHYAIAKELRNTKWMPAKDKGIPITSRQGLYGCLYFNKHVYKKYNCWPSFLMRLIF